MKWAFVLFCSETGRASLHSLGCVASQSPHDSWVVCWDSHLPSQTLSIFMMKTFRVLVMCEVCAVYEYPESPYLATLILSNQPSSPGSVLSPAPGNHQTAKLSGISFVMFHMREHVILSFCARLIDFNQRNDLQLYLCCCKFTVMEIQHSIVGEHRFLPQSSVDRHPVFSLSLTIVIAL